VGQSDRDPKASVIIAEFVRRVDAGEPVDPQLVLARYPECADELREYFTGEQLLGNAFGRATRPGRPVAERVTVPPTATDSVPAAAATFDQLPMEFGRYRVLKVLGQGAMGAVYLAHDTKLGRDVALKTPKIDRTTDLDLVGRFKREARSAAMLRHRNICPVFDVGEINGVHFLTMAYINGKCLSSLVSQERPLPGRKVALVVRKLALGLQEAHANGVIHRDLKPANVMIDQAREPVVMDFGLARQLENSEQSRLTHVGTVMGSPAYMSPEQVSGELDAVGPSTDIYSLGVILFELLTGHLPYEGSVVAILGQILTANPPDISEYRTDIDPDLAELCNRMIARNPSDRFATMQDVANALTIWLKQQHRSLAQPTDVSAPMVFDELPVTETPWSSPRKKPQKDDRRIDHQLKWFAGGVIAAVVLVAGFVFFLRAPYGMLRVDVDGDPKVLHGIEVIVDGHSVSRTQTEQFEVGTHELDLKVGDTLLPFDPNTRHFVMSDNGSQHQLSVSDGGMQLSGTTFTIAKNKVTSLKIELQLPTEIVANATQGADADIPADSAAAISADQPPLFWADLFLSPDITRNVICGEWEQTGPAIVADGHSGRLAAKQFLCPHLSEFEIELDFETTSALQYPGVILSLPIRESRCFVSFWAPDWCQIAVTNVVPKGATRMDDQRSIGTNRSEAGTAIEVALNERCTLNVKVRQNGSQSSIVYSMNGETVMDWTGDPMGLSEPQDDPPNFWRGTRPEGIAIGVDSCSVKFHSARFRPL